MLSLMKLNKRDSEPFETFVRDKRKKHEVF